MRTMYDSTTAADIPSDAVMVAGYVDGRYKWSQADWARFPHAVKVRIACFATTDDGHVLDVETGNATPAESVDWVRLRRASGVDPTVYCAESNWATIRGEFAARKVYPPHWWIANYNKDAFPTGAIAWQYLGSPGASPGHYDVSLVADYWPGVDNIITTVKEHPMANLLIITDVQTGGVYLLGLTATPIHIAASEDEVAILAAIGQRGSARVSHATAVNMGCPA